MWPLSIDWEALRFGVEIEFVGGDPEGVALLPGWKMARDEQQIDSAGADSGSELQSPPLRWQEREQIREMLGRLRATGAAANWSCGLHIHVGLEAWGQASVQPLLAAALTCQDALQALLRTAADRLVYCPRVTTAIAQEFAANPTRSALVHRGRPQSHRCGINTGAWFDIGTVEIRYANGSLIYDEVVRTVELCLRFVAAVGAGRTLPADAAALAAALGAPADGYPPPAPAPLWYRERVWTEDALLPVLGPLALSRVPGGEIQHIRPTAAGFVVTVEGPEDEHTDFLLRHGPAGWEVTPA